MRTKVGLSLSRCICDLAEDRVRIDEVARIVTGTRATDENMWEKLIESYSRTYWREYPERARELVNFLRKDGRIEQLRLTRSDEPVPDLNGGNWIEQDTIIPIYFY